jgi:hypothetical protein
MILLLGTSINQAQGLKIGVYADPMYSWLNVESRTAHTDGASIGIDGGLVLENYFKRNYALQTGISLGTQGGGILFDEQKTFLSYDVTDTLPAGTTVDYQLNYISVPLGLKLKTNEIGYFSYFARLGLNNQVKLKVRATSSDETLDKSVIEDEVFFYNLSYYIGIGIQYSISKDTAFNLALTFNNGFINLSLTDGIKYFTRSVNLRLGIIF